MKSIWAVRGATTISRDEPALILEATEELLLKLFQANKIQTDDIVSIIFTVTHDIQSEFPAVAARKIGITTTPLLCALEIPKTGSLPLCIRVLIHFYTALPKSSIQPIYLREAVKLRLDLASNE